MRGVSIPARVISAAAFVALLASLTACSLGATSASKLRKASQTPTATTTATSGSAYQSETFTSAQLGISFSYAPQLGGDPIATKQVDNIVYVYDTTLPYADGQYVQVLQKSAAQNLQQTLSASILQGYTSANCPIGPGIGASSAYPASYTAASITYATTPDPNGGWPTANPANCPTQYAIAPEGGMAYFLTDSKHPTRLLFISIGLDAIAASTDPNSHTLWQDTITFQ